MLEIQKFNLLGVDYAALNYTKAVDIIIQKAAANNSFGVSALAVHGLMEAHNNKSLNTLINKIDLVVPDGQPIKWALNYFFNTQLADRVYGPTLTWKVLETANEKGLAIYLYGSTQITLDSLINEIKISFPNITIAGYHIDRFRDATPSEDADDIIKINASGAHIVLVGRGCPRQEVWVAEHLGKVNAVMMAVGAAFDFHAKTVKQAPSWMQDNGLEWLFRLKQEPKRLWKRYLVTNSKFIFLILFKLFKIHK